MLLGNTNESCGQFTINTPSRLTIYIVQRTVAAVLIMRRRRIADIVCAYMEVIYVSIVQKAGVHNINTSFVFSSAVHIHRSAAPEQ